MQISRFGVSSVLGWLCVLSTGCTPLRLLGQWSDAELSLQVTPISDGTYAIAGNTTLPENTQITVAAIRYLQLDAPTVTPQTLASPQADDTYAILDYQSTIVSQNRWDATLQLWETAPDGRWQESWQLDQQRLNVAFNPDEQVVFVATLAPVEELAEIEQLLARQRQRLNKGLIRSTTEGQRYLNVSQSLAIALPTEQTTPPVPRPEDRNGGWGDRFLIPPEPPIPIQLEVDNARQTTAPATAAEFLQ